MDSFSVDSLGIIRTPGKFQGEPLYAPHYWTLAMDGYADEDIDDNGTLIAVFAVNAEDRAEFPHIGADTHAITIWEDHDGFVHTSEVTKEQLDKGRAETVSYSSEEV